MPDEAAYDESLEAAYDDAAGDGEEDFEVIRTRVLRRYRRLWYSRRIATSRCRSS